MKQPSPGLLPKGIANLEQVLQGILDRNVAPGCALAIGRGDQMLYSKALGYADISSKAPIRLDTVYRIYSMTKLVTTTALLQLYEQGRFQMVQPVSDFLPGFKNPRVFEKQDNGSVVIRPAAREVQIQDLFTMTSGIPYQGTDPAGKAFAELYDAMYKDAENGQRWGTVKIANETGRLPLAFDPGARFRYGFSIDVLGGVLEVITGMPLDAYCRKYIFEPLHMEDTSFRLREDMRPRLAHVYEPAENGGYLDISDLSKYENPPFISGGGGLLSTLGDYFRFAAMLHNQGTLQGTRILSRKAVEMMRTPHLTPAQQPSYEVDMCNHRGYTYGLGVRVLRDPAHCNMLGTLGEWGWSGAAGTWVAMDPTEDLFFVYMHQRMPADHDLYVPELVTAIYAALD